MEQCLAAVAPSPEEQESLGLNTEGDELRAGAIPVQCD